MMSGRSLLATLANHLSALFTFGTRRSPASGVVDINQLLATAVEAGTIAERLQQARQADQEVSAAFGADLTELPVATSIASSNHLQKLTQYAVEEGLSHLVQFCLPGPVHGPSIKDVDPFGIYMAFHARHPLRPVVWQHYAWCAQQLLHLSLTADDARMERLLQYCQLRRKAATAGGLPQASSAAVLDLQKKVQAECTELEQYIAALLTWRTAHQLMIRRDLAKVDLVVLELQAKIRLGNEFQGSQVQDTLERAKLLRQKALQERNLTADDWQALEAHLAWLSEHLNPQRSVSTAVTLQIQEYENELLERLAQLPSRARLATV